jgi:TusA-related sulfurtransferase
MVIEKLIVEEAHFANAIMKIAGKSLSMQQGDILEIDSSYKSDISRSLFKKGIQSWCEKSNKHLVFLEEHDKDTARWRIRI